MPKKTILTIILSSFFIAACASPQRSVLDMGITEGQSFAEAPAAEPAAEESGGEFAVESVDTGERIVIKNGNLEIVVDAPEKSMETISRMAESMGGYVVTANLYKTQLSDGQEVPRASITIRVPAENLDEALERIEAESDQLPLSKNIQSQDITSDYTDLQSRLTNLEAAEAQLMEIMASANKTEDVLNVFDQLTRVREQIEVIKGQIKYYDESARLSAISVELIPNAAVQPITIGGWEPVGVAKNAIQSLIRALQWLAGVLIYLVLLVLPILLIIVLPIYLIVRGVRRWRRRRQGDAQAESKDSTQGSNQED